MRGSLGGKAPDKRQSIGTAGQCGVRLETQVAGGQMRIPLGNVGWIADDDIKALSSQSRRRECRQQIALHKADAGAMTPGIGLCDSQMQPKWILLTCASYLGAVVSIIHKT